MKLRKVKTEKAKDIGKYTLEKTTYVPDKNGKIEVRIIKPVKVKTRRH